MKEIPAFDHVARVPVLIIAFDKVIAFDNTKPQELGQQWMHVLIAQVSDEAGRIYSRRQEDLTILWPLARLTNNSTPTFKSIKHSFIRLVERSRQDATTEDVDQSARIDRQKRRERCDAERFAEGLELLGEI